MGRLEHGSEVHLHIGDRHGSGNQESPPHRPNSIDELIISHEGPECASASVERREEFDRVTGWIVTDGRSIALLRFRGR